MQAAEPFHADQVKTLAMRVEQEIERQILTGDLGAGDKVNEVALARDLGVSRGPVREALQGLHRAGMVLIVANKGAVVRTIDMAEAGNLYDLRAVVWAVMAERLSGERSQAQLEALHASIRSMAAAIAADAREAYYRLNLQFHEDFVDFSGMERAATTYQGIVKEMHLFRRRGLLRSIPNMEQSLREHRAVVEAIERRDTGAAFASARGHVLAGKRRFLASFAADGAERGDRLQAPG